MWYIIGLIAALCFVIYGIINGIYLLSIVALLFPGVYILMENNNSPLASVKIDEAGVHVDESHYFFSDMESFALIRIDNIPSILRIKQTKTLAPLIDIPLSPEIDTGVLQDFLLQHVAEDKNAKFTNADAFIHMTGL